MAYVRICKQVGAMPMRNE